MKSFREIIKDKEINESAVGKVGRTKDSEALAHIESSDLAKQFRKIVKQLGGKNVARQLLVGMNNTGKKIEVSEASETVEQFLRTNGYKIKAENPKIRKKEIVFFNSNDTEMAYTDLVDNGFEDRFNLELNAVKKTITYI